MKAFTYDGTFEGFLTSVFECYRLKAFPVDIYPRGKKQKSMFASEQAIVSDPVKAARVWKGIIQKLTARNNQMVFYAYLSEEPGIEMKIYRFIRRLFSTAFNIETDFSDPDVLYLVQSARKVKKEAMRMLQFVRFQHTADGLYFCGIEPEYDVIPMVIKHFSNRFADQKWLLYDLKRNYGILRERETIEEVYLSEIKINASTGAAMPEITAESEEFYKKLWQSYFLHISIAERKNLKLQRQHMPRRFWKYLPEMSDRI
jgi:probable DNA metabolism protein